MRNGSMANGRAPHNGSGSLVQPLSNGGRAYGSAPSSSAETRLANDIAELIGRRPSSSGRPAFSDRPSSGGPGRLAEALARVEPDPIFEEARAAEREALFVRSAPPPLPRAEGRPDLPPNPAYLMPGALRVADPHLGTARPGTWIKKARRKRRLGLLKAAASWMTAIAIVGTIVATSAVLLGAPRDLNGYVQIGNALLRR